MDTTLSLEERVDTLMVDWFDRDAVTYTFAVKKGRIDWESEITDGDYSSFFIKTTDVDSIIKKAYQLAKNMVVTMCIPTRVNVKLTNEGTAATNGKDLFVTTSMFDEKKLSLNGRIDVFLGFVIHEGCHLLYTDFEDEKISKNRLIFSIYNILEDERIERLLGHEKPGLERYLSKVKEYVFGKYSKDREEISAELTDKQKKFGRLFNTFFNIIRFPGNVVRENVEEFVEYIEKIKDVLTPYPTSTSDIWDASYKVYDIIKEFIDEKDEKDAEESEEEIIKALLDVFSKHFARCSENPDAEIKTATDMGKFVPKVLSGELELDGKGRYFVKEKDNVEEYSNILRSVQRYIPSMRKALEYNDIDYKLIHRNKRSGVLDTTRLVDAIQNVPTIYKRNGEVFSDAISVCLLLDMSGSMGYSKMRAANECAVLLFEALKNNHSIQLFIYGHTADLLEYGKNQLHIFYEPTYKMPKSLGNSKSLCQNKDGDAIRQTATRVRSFTTKKCLMFVISDGQPCASSYHGDLAIEDTRLAVLEVEKQDIDCVQIAIEHGYEPSLMFKKYIVLTDISTLAKDINKFIKKEIINKQKIHVA